MYAVIGKKSVNETVWEQSLFWLRRGRLTAHAKNMLFLGVCIIAAIVLPFVATDLTIVVISALLCAVLVGAFVVSQQHDAKIRHEFDDAEPIAYRHVATPMATLLNTLARECVEPSQIKELVFETGSQKEAIGYFKSDGGELLGLVDANSDLNVVIYGFNDLSPKEESIRTEFVKRAPERIRFFDTKEKAFTHRDLISTKDGRDYLWFEEHHEVSSGHHYYPSGAYLFKLRPASRQKIIQALDKSRAA